MLEYSKLVLVYEIKILTSYFRRCSNMEEFMDQNPNALTADILEFISDQDDFYDDAAPAINEAS